MKRTTRILSALIAVSMLAGVMLTGCQSDKKENNPSSAQTNSTTSNVPEEKKHELTVMGSEDATTPFSFKDREKFESYNKIMELLASQNITVTFESIATEQYEVVAQTRMAAATKLPDIVQLNKMGNAAVLALAKQKIIQPLNASIDSFSNGNIKHMYTEVYPSALPLTLAPDGEMYWFSSLHQLTYEGKTPAPYAMTVSYRKDWADKLSIKEPTTIDEFTNMLRAFRDKDANGSGKQDEILNVIVETFTNGIAQWFGLGATLTAYDSSTQKIVSPWLQPGVKDYFKYINMLVKEKIIDASILNNAEMTNQRLVENKVAGTYDYAVPSWLEESITGVDNALFQPLMPLKAVDGITPIMQVEPPDLVWDKFAITKACTDVEGAIKFFDTVYSDEYADLCMWGVKDSTYTIGENGQKVATVFASEAEQAEKGIAAARVITAGMMPKVQIAQLESDINGADTEEKKAFLRNMITYPQWTPNNSSNFEAMPTDEEVEISQKYLTTLETYSAELATKLALGQKSLDDWDSYIAELNNLGLDKIMAIDQARLDRYLSAKK